MKTVFIIKLLFGLLLILFTGWGCSMRYCDSEGHDTLIGFPPVLNEVETAAGSNDRITWRRMRRTGIGLDLSPHSFGLMIGYEHIFLLWGDGDGAWDMSYSPGKGMVITESNLISSP